jgi:hypothetical protein
LTPHSGGCIGRQVADNEVLPTPPYAGKRRAQPSHRALTDQIVFDETNDECVGDVCNVEGMTIEELQRSLAALEKEKADLGRKIAKVLPAVRNQATFNNKLERENDEKQYDLVSRMIGRIRLELRWKKNRNR